MDASMECVVLVLLEMGLSFSGIVCNLLVVATLRNEERLQGSTLNYLLLNLCFSNLLISFLVKPISAIYVGYAISTNEWRVGLTFCTLYTFTYRTTWCVFPFTLVAMCWCKLLAQCKCRLCGLLLTFSKKLPFQPPSSSKDEAIALEETQVAHIKVSSYLSYHNRQLLEQQQQSQNHMNNDNYAPFTELALQYGSGTIRTGGNLLFQNMTRDSLSTPTPSTITENCPQAASASATATTAVRGVSVDTVDEIKEEEVEEDADQANNASSAAEKDKNKKPKRTIEDGPNARQKVLVAFIWLGSAFFGVTTCFPDKVFGVAMSQKILEEQLRTMVPPSAGTPRGNLDLTYCSVKTGVNDLLDYIALMVALVLPLIIGPGAVAVFQGFFSLLGRFFCQHAHVNKLETAAMMAAGPAGAAIHSAAEAEAEANPASKPLFRSTPGKGPGWSIIAAFTLVFVTSYPLHMYVAEIYVVDNFTFLFLKYTVGFLFLLFVPLCTVALQSEIRSGIVSVFGSGVLCMADGVNGAGSAAGNNNNSDEEFVEQEPMMSNARNV